MTLLIFSQKAMKRFAAKRVEIEKNVKNRERKIIALLDFSDKRMQKTIHPGPKNRRRLSCASKVSLLQSQKERTDVILQRSILVNIKIAI